MHASTLDGIPVGDGNHSPQTVKELEANTRIFGARIPINCYLQTAIEHLPGNGANSNSI